MNSFNREVEFLTGDPSNVNLDIQFGFQLDSSLASGTALSYTDTCSLDYQSNDLRNSNDLSSSNVLSSSLLSNSGSGKLNGTSTLQQTSQAQQANSNTANIHQSTQLSQHPVSSAQQNHQQTATQVQPSQPSQHSLQQQQQQMYTAAAAQFPSYGFPYLYSPVANMRDVEQFTTLAPFPYGLNGINQLDMQLSAMLPPSMASAATGGSTAATGSNQGNGPNSGLTSSINNPASQGHHQLSQQSSQPSQLQQHRNTAQDGKYQSQVQPGGLFFIFFYYLCYYFRWFIK